MNTNARTISEPVKFRQLATDAARAVLADWVGEDRAAEAIGRVSTALSAAAASARNPSDFYACTPASVAKVIAISALTGIMPGSGQGALAYAIPRRPRKGEAPQLQYQLSHRGVCAMAKRAGSVLIATPVGVKDVIKVTPDDVRFSKRDIDNPPDDKESLRGVVVTVKRADNGAVLHRGFVAKSTIEKRHAKAQTEEVWSQWYVEMAMKTALHYAINRGWCVIDDTSSVRALQADVEGVVEGEVVSKSVTTTELAARIVAAETAQPGDADLLDALEACETLAEVDGVQEQYFGVDQLAELCDARRRQLKETAK